MKSIILIALFALAAKATADEICGRESGTYKVHIECNKFYMCNSGYSNIFECPNNLYFDGTACTYRENVPECVGGTRVPPTEPEVPVQPVPEEPTPVDPVPEEPTPVDPVPEEPTPVDPVPEEPTPVDPVPEEPAPVDPVPEEPAPVDPVVPNPGDIQCPSSPFYYLPVPSNPNQFYICQSGQYKGESNCSPGLVFNQAKQACVFP